eukprot:CCRYP_005248-RA/>CCRYP_005248-RA protein AED:0.20 eAED:0.20 QI:0/0/0/1/1/1/3/0/215
MLALDRHDPLQGDGEEEEEEEEEEALRVRLDPIKAFILWTLFRTGELLLHPLFNSWLLDSLGRGIKYMDGSLFDWPLGQDPSTVSFLGEVRTHPSHSSVLEMTPQWTMVCDRRESIGFVHSGSLSAQNMIIDEDNASRNIALIFRAVLLLWSIPSARLLGVALGREVGDSLISMQDMATAGMFGSVLGGMWLLIWVTDVFLLWVDALVSWHGGCP